MKTVNGRYPTGEPREYAFPWVGGCIAAVFVILTIWFIADGYGGALFSLILMLITLGLLLAVPIGLGMMVWGLITKHRGRMNWGFLVFIIGLIGFVIVAVLRLIFQ